MRLRGTQRENEKRFVNLRAAADYTGLGLQMADKLAIHIGAKKTIGHRCVYDLKKLEEYLENNNLIIFD